MDVSARLTELRKMRGLTTNKLANLAGISQSHLRDIELGLRNPTVETLSYFCEVLGVSLAEFFSEEKTEISPFLMSAIKGLSAEQQEILADFIHSLKK